MCWSKTVFLQKNIPGEITFIKKTGREIILIVGQCSICNRKKSINASRKTIEAEGLGGFFKNLGKKGLNVSKKMAKNVSSNPTRALDITANIATAAASRNPRNVMSTLPEVIIFYRTGSGFYLGKFIKIMLYKWSKKVIDYTQAHH